MSSRDEIAPALDAEEVIENQGVTRIESLCVNCEENGFSSFLLVRVPYFRDIIICAFECPHCGFRSNEVQSVDGLSENGGVKFTVNVSEPSVLNRQVIKSNYASILIPELEFEIPSITQRGEINTIEGFISNAAENLQKGQDARRLIDPETTQKIQEVIDRLVGLSTGAEPFTLVLTDPSGHSFIENPFAPEKDKFGVVEYFQPTKQQLQDMGFVPDDQVDEEEEKTTELKVKEGGASAREGFKVSGALSKKLDTFFDVTQKVAAFQGNCHACHADSEVRMCMTDIPNFGPIVIMVSDCEKCGYKDSEVKPGGAISQLGKKISLKVTTLDDLSRDLIKSDSAAVLIPEVDLELAPGTLGGKYTTVEGILDDIYKQLTESNPFALGDSADAADQVSGEEENSRFRQWLEKFSNLKKCLSQFTLIIDDPLGNVYIQNPLYPSGDPNLKIETYERTFEQNEELGLNDIDTEDYPEE